MYTKILSTMIRLILSCRYRVVIKNIDVFDVPESILILSNHPAFIDPIILLSYLSKKKDISPVITHKYSQIFGISTILSWIQAIIVPIIDDALSKNTVAQVVLTINRSLKDQKNILLYPAWKIYSQWFESILGKRMAYDVISWLDSNARVIFVHTTWLWWSIWSKSYTGENPKIWTIFFRSLYFFFINLFFLMPKREVSIECDDITDTIREWSREDLPIFNQKLEDLYNKNGAELCNYIPHYFFYDDTANKIEPKNIVGSLSEMQKSWIEDAIFRPETVFQVYDIIATIKWIHPSTLTLHTHLLLDLQMDSLDMMELSTIVHSQFPNASNPALQTLRYISDIAYMASWGQRIPDDTTLFSNDQAYSLRQYIHNAWYRDIGVLFPEQLISVLKSEFQERNTRVIELTLEWGEEEFFRQYHTITTKVIVTSHIYYRDLRHPWLAQYEENFIFIEDIPMRSRIFSRILGW